MKQGDQYKVLIPYDIKDDDDVEIPIANINKVEFCLDKLIKEYPTVVTYDSTEKNFEFPVTKEETYAIMPGNAPCQMRVHFTDGTIQSSNIAYEKVGECLIKESGNAS